MDLLCSDSDSDGDGRAETRPYDMGQGDGLAESPPLRYGAR